MLFPMVPATERHGIFIVGLDAHSGYGLVDARVSHSDMSTFNGYIVLAYTAGKMPDEIEMFLAFDSHVEISN